MQSSHFKPCGTKRYCVCSSLLLVSELLSKQELLKYSETMLTAGLNDTLCSYLCYSCFSEKAIQMSKGTITSACAVITGWTCSSSSPVEPDPAPPGLALVLCALSSLRPVKPSIAFISQMKENETAGCLKSMKWYAYYTWVCVKETLVSSASAFNSLKTICLKMWKYLQKMHGNNFKINKLFHGRLSWPLSLWIPWTMLNMKAGFIHSLQLKLNGSSV